MSSSWHRPPDRTYWSTPRQPKSTRTVNGNQNVIEISSLSSVNKSVSEPSSPQQWHKVLSVDESEDFQRNQEKCQTISRIGARHKKHSLTRQPSEGAELAELLETEHQGRQVQGMNGLNTGACRQWVSCSRLNELHPQTSRPSQYSTTANTVHCRHVEFAMKDELSPFEASEYQIMSQASAQNPSAASAPIGHVQEGSVVRAGPLTVIGEGYVNSSSRASHSISPSNDDSDKWASLLRAKDDLIGQKDQIIERQKQSIFQLQQHVLQMSTPHPQASRTVSVDSDANMVLKLQEFQYQNAQLRAHLADKDSSIDRLQKKLGETEYLLENMKASVKDSTASNRQELEQLQQKSVEQEKAVAELTSKIGQLEEEKLKLKREKQSLERYLGDVPTVEEHQKTLKTLKNVREECDSLKETICSKDKKLARVNKAFNNKNDEVKKLTVENTVLKDNVQRLQVSLDKLNCDGPVSMVSFEDLKMENEGLQGELERTKKMLETKQNKIKALHYQAQNEQKSLEDRLAQEEDMVTALRRELVDKETSLEEVKKAVREIASQNQDLLEENLNLQNCCGQLKIACSKDNMDAGKQLWKELLDCTKELQAVVEVCRERKEGKHPEMSVLFDLRSSSVDNEVYDDMELSDDLNAIKSKIDGVQRLRSDVSDLRKFICDQYAEDIGNNCRMQ